MTHSTVNLVYTVYLAGDPGGEAISNIININGQCYDRQAACIRLIIYFRSEEVALCALCFKSKVTGL